MINATTSNSISTSAITFVETEHGRLRRKQRGIDKKDLQTAKKYGIRYSTHPRPNGDPSSRYVYKDITYIVNDVTGEEVTCYAKPLELEEVPVTLDMIAEYTKASVKIRMDLQCWTSNSVLVVDTSGSMKEADMWGTRTRLGAVWVSIALDFLASRLETGGGGLYDVVSVVALGNTAQILFEEEPCSWVLYNKLVKLYSESLVAPRGHGPFLPSLETAERLLLRNPNASCAVSLTFLSDGRPSDAAVGAGMTKEDCYETIENKVGELAKQFGRRLTFRTIGIGKYDDFEMLQRMADAADDYGAHAEFCFPSMTSSALGEVFSSVATSISSTQLELTDGMSKKQRHVRSVNRESRKKAGEDILKVFDNDFYIYRRDQTTRKTYKEWFEVDSDNKRKVKHHYDKTELQHPDARYVAFARGPFGEGAERFAYRFFEIAPDRKTIVGKAMVAKESRLILDDTDVKARKEYTATFCKTQQLARRFANEFNAKMKGLYRVDERTPTVSFLDCSIYELDDETYGVLSVLVEDKLDHAKWQKWNSNNGFVEGMKKAPVFSDERMRQAEINMTRIAHFEADVIEEGSEEEDDSEEENEPSGELARKDAIVFTPFEVAQAFSHFSYCASGRKRLVCDLQGVYDEANNMLLFSDPVIHYHNPGGYSCRKNVHGRTDHGKEGMQKFFDTHNDHCGHLCKLVNRGFWKVRGFEMKKSSRDCC